MADLQILRTELLIDPLGRGYSGMTDQQAADNLNMVNRESPPNSAALLQYLTLERFRTGTLYGRLKLVADSRPTRAGNAWAIPPLPIGVADADVVITQQHISAAATILRYVDTDTGLAVSVLDTRLNVILDALTACEAIGPNDKTAIRALSENQRSRGIEIGFGLVRPGDVQNARA